MHRVARRAVSHWSARLTNSQEIATELHRSARPHIQQGLNSAMLRRLLELCSSPEDLSAARGVLDLFHRKRVEIDEHVATTFVDACMRLERPQSAARAMSGPRSRIMLWLDADTCLGVLRSLRGTQDGSQLMVEVLHAMHVRGPGADEHAHALVIDALLEENRPEVAEQIAHIGRAPAETVAAIQAALEAKRADEPTVEDQQPEDAVAAGDDVDEGGTVDHPERG